MPVCERFSVSSCFKSASSESNACSLTGVPLSMAVVLDVPAGSLDLSGWPPGTSQGLIEVPAGALTWIGYAVDATRSFAAPLLLRGVRGDEGDLEIRGRDGSLGVRGGSSTFGPVRGD